MVKKVPDNTQTRTQQELDIMNRRSFLKSLVVGLVTFLFVGKIVVPKVEPEEDSFYKLGESKLTVEGIKEAMDSMRKFKSTGDYVIGYRLDDGSLVTVKMINT